MKIVGPALLFHEAWPYFINAGIFFKLPILGPTILKILTCWVYGRTQTPKCSKISWADSDVHSGLRIPVMRFVRLNKIVYVKVLHKL